MKNDCKNEKISPKISRKGQEALVNKSNTLINKSTQWSTDQDTGVINVVQAMGQSVDLGGKQI